jgi:hypothetical protein
VALASLSPLSSALAATVPPAEPKFPSFSVTGGNLFILDPEEPVDVIYVGSYVTTYSGPLVHYNVIDSGGRLNSLAWWPITNNTKFLRQGDTKRLISNFTRYGGEVILKLRTASSLLEYYTGDRKRNRDNYPHAKVVYDYAGPGTALVGFEQEYGGGDRDYNDAVFIVTNVTRNPPIYQPSGKGNISGTMPSWPTN